MRVDIPVAEHVVPEDAQVAMNVDAPDDASEVQEECVNLVGDWRVLPESSWRCLYSRFVSDFVGDSWKPGVRVRIRDTASSRCGTAGVIESADDDDVAPRWWVLLDVRGPRPLVRSYRQSALDIVSDG
eukprot:TRINITY_DN55693_c0_g1_i1.p1 TRINITY_DN55693_c0_g1~~TRINITY_DN55693_c0_g1_i1.p1  ORF type:complete len:138 (-),score=21.38 TRINITY_DN55693_c0_g1_i1:66-449(-)